MEKTFGYLLMRHFLGFVGRLTISKKIRRIETAKLSYCLFYKKNTILVISTNISWLLFVIKAANPTIIETLKEIASWSSKREKKMRVWSSHFYDLTPKEKRNKLPYHDEERCRNEIKLTSIDKLCFNTAPELGRGSTILVSVIYSSKHIHMAQ